MKPMHRAYLNKGKSTCVSAKNRIAKRFVFLINFIGYTGNDLDSISLTLFKSLDYNLIVVAIATGQRLL